MRGGNRRRRAGMWIAGLAVITAIAATYQFTRPRELVWWTSPPLGRTGRRVRALVPSNLILAHPYAWNHYSLVSPEKPAWLRRFLPDHTDALSYSDPLVEIYYAQSQRKPADWPRPSDTSVIDDLYVNRYVAERSVRKADLWIFISYFRNDRDTFYRTYSTICNSLRIE